MKKIITKVQSHLYHYECVDCENQFTRKFKTDENICFECSNSTSFSCDTETFEEDVIYCPICAEYFKASSHLSNVIKDEHILWLANMVTHYRHNHIKYWNRMWCKYGNRYRHGWFDDFKYNELKTKVNEQAKRQILRKCKQFMIENGFTVNHVKQLEHTDDKTISLYVKLLNAESLNHLTG